MATYRSRKDDEEMAPQQGRRGTALGGMATRGGLGAGKKQSIFDSIPPEYRYNPTSTQPLLHYLPKIENALNLRQLLKAANADIRLHRARVKAALENNVKLGEFCRCHWHSNHCFAHYRIMVVTLHNKKCVPISWRMILPMPT